MKHATIDLTDRYECNTCKDLGYVTRRLNGSGTGQWNTDHVVTITEECPVCQDKTRQKQDKEQDNEAELPGWRPALDDQYQEEMDFQMGIANEWQNAFAVSCLERKPDDSQQIAELVAAGRFVLVMQTEECCPRTDAVMGVRQTLLADFAERAGAEQYAATDDTGDLVVLPPPVRSELAAITDDIPF